MILIILIDLDQLKQVAGERSHSSTDTMLGLKPLLLSRSFWATSLSTMFTSFSPREMREFQSLSPKTLVLIQIFWSWVWSLLSSLHMQD